MKNKKAFVQSIITALAQTGNFRTRILSDQQIAEALKIHLEVLKKNSPTDQEGFIRTRIYGGAVCNSYKYSATADMVDICTDSNKSWSVRVLRTSAPKFSHGNGPTLTSSFIRTGKTQGKVLFRANV